METLGMSAWDVIVVGGGPGGSTAAWELAKRGRRALVLDAAAFPRVKLCAGWVTKQVMGDLKLDPNEYPHTIQPFQSVFVGYDDKLLETRWSEPASYGIIRSQFDTWLLRRAQEEGAEVREGVRVRGVEKTSGGMRVDVGDEKIEAPLVIGAGGHTCPVARAFGDVSSKESVVLTQESETNVGAEKLRVLAPNYGLPELFAEPDFKGYAWYFTKGDFLNIGVGCIGKKPSVHERLDILLEKFRETGRLPAKMELTKFRGHAYSVHRRHVRRPAGDGFALIGDAAGLAKDFSGEGIGPAVHSAKMAAEAAHEYLETGKGLAEYGEALYEKYGSGGEGLFDKLIDRLPDKVLFGVAKFICGNAWLRRRLVLEGAFGIG